MAKIYPLSEGIFTVGHDKKFVPFNPDTDVLNERPTGSLLVEVQPFLVVTGNDVIVLDTGLGFRTTDDLLRIHDNVRQYGYEPGQVTKVLLSHLHKDHAGCLVYSDYNGLVKTTFPNARYYIYRAEADYALKMGAIISPNTDSLRSYVVEDIEPLLGTDQVEWLDGETGTIDGYIHFTHSGGHCPYHVVYFIDDGEDKIFFGGDEAPQLKQLRIKYIAKYDFDGKKAMQLREQYAEQGRKEGWKFLFYHDVKNAVASL